MAELSFWSRFRSFTERESMRPDLGRGLRAAFAVAVPLFLSAQGWLPLNVTFVVFAAQSIAIVDVRGAYTVRLAVLLVMAGILAGVSELGGLVSSSLFASILVAAVVAAAGGLWRHFTPDYGAPLAISSSLLFLISLHAPPAASSAEHGLAALVGALWGVFLQIANWPIRPQHPLRRAASDSWLAVADLFAALGPDASAVRTDEIHRCESALRTTLDQTYAVLAAARPTPLRVQLEELNLAAARLATRVVALNTSLESLPAGAASAGFIASLQPVLTSLTNTSRTVAVTVVSRQPAHLATCEVRVQRLTNLLRAVIEQTPGAGERHDAAAPVRGILRQIEQHLPAMLATLRTTVDRAGERAAFSPELLDLDTWRLRSLASAINLRGRIDPALVRFTARAVVLMMVGVAAFKYLHLPHGYWLPLTMVIVLQPDYGSTRQRAAQRVLGTLAGSIAGSAFLWLDVPLAVITATTAATMFFFAFFLKRRYAVAVFFITLAVVLLTEAHEPVSLSFAVERLVTTLAGGTLAILAALFIWPVWERQRLPPILLAALEANRDFAGLIATRIENGGTYDPAAIDAKRRAETANSDVFSSLQRMMGDPHNRREGLDQVAACANGNQRVTRALTALAIQLTAGSSSHSFPIAQGFQRVNLALATLIAQLRGPTESAREILPTTPSPVSPRSTLPDSAADSSPPKEHWILGQLARIDTELKAMQLALAPNNTG